MLQNTESKQEPRGIKGINQHSDQSVVSSHLRDGNSHKGIILGVQLGRQGRDWGERGDGGTEGVGMGLRAMCSILQCALHCAVLSCDCNGYHPYIPPTHSLLYVWLCAGLIVTGKGWGQGWGVCLVCMCLCACGIHWQVNIHCQQ